MPEEEKQEEKTTINFGENERQILASLSRHVQGLSEAIDKLTQQIITLAKKD